MLHLLYILLQIHVQAIHVKMEVFAKVMPILICTHVRVSFHGEDQLVKKGVSIAYNGDRIALLFIQP